MAELDAHIISYEDLEQKQRQKKYELDCVKYEIAKL